MDMDAFFVSVEALADPSLRGRPVIVGGVGERGVVASCSYEARAYGVHSAMPSIRARRLCPQAIWLAGNHDAYAEVSRSLHQVLESFSPLVEGIALDEAFLDVSGAERLFGPAPRIARDVRAAVRERLHLDCSVGVASCKLLAKLASEAAKPRVRPAGPVAGPGVVVVGTAEELSFLHPLPVRALWGVGPVTSERLARIGVTRVGQVAQIPVACLVATFGAGLGRQLHDLAWARDPRVVQPNRELKSVGHEETYSEDHSDLEFLHRQVVRMADAVAVRLRAAGRVAKTVTLKVRFGDFSTITRSRSFPAALSEGLGIARAALDLLSAVDIGPGVRLLGVSASGLGRQGGAVGVQLSLDLEPAGGAVARGSAGVASPATVVGDRATAAAIGEAVGLVRKRFGADAVGPAALAASGRGVDVKRMGSTQWGPVWPDP